MIAGASGSSLSASFLRDRSVWTIHPFRDDAFELQLARMFEVFCTLALQVLHIIEAVTRGLEQPSEPPLALERRPISIALLLQLAKGPCSKRIPLTLEIFPLKRSSEISVGNHRALFRLRSDGGASGKRRGWTAWRSPLRLLPTPVCHSNYR
jgi:hypothetical protein